MHNPRTLQVEQFFWTACVTGVRASAISMFAVSMSISLSLLYCCFCIARVITLNSIHIKTYHMAGAQYVYARSKAKFVELIQIEVLIAQELRKPARCYFSHYVQLARLFE